jgi:hypothetical protein
MRPVCSGHDRLRVKFVPDCSRSTRRLYDHAS